MRWAVHVACMGDRRGAYMVLCGDLMERNCQEDLGIFGSIIKRWIFKKWNEWACTGLMWPRIETGSRIL